ncbi:unnamed protein product [Ranitomeya imitator]|uniref:VWFA domain-containing protein n=1 Tax=Ranitomeya imitator TaxID=111125 RepID=A0ABN9LQE4_9NEOB|nr:unnamed protein product [Ranitomeya imitator]
MGFRLIPRDSDSTSCQELWSRAWSMSSSATKSGCFLMSFGTDVSCPWEYPQDINIRVLHEARQWIQEMQPRGGCNLLLALRKTLQIQELDTLVVIVSNCFELHSQVYAIMRKAT